MLHQVMSNAQARKLPCGLQTLAGWSGPFNSGEWSDGTCVVKSEAGNKRGFLSIG